MTDVFVFQMWHRSIVFHLTPKDFDRSWIKDELEDGRHRGRHMTSCGRVIYESTWGGGTCRDREYATRLRRDHAEKLGRMCRRCETAEAA